MPTPQPRSHTYYGMPFRPVLASNDTWLEPESLCYSHGGKTRRAYALCPDGHKRIVWCGIPDTYFSIPAKSIRINGKLTRGYIGSHNDAITFNPFTNQ